MVERMASLDWTPVLDARPSWRPAMVTLTLPGDWLAVAPRSEDFTAMVDRFRKRVEREWWTCGKRCSDECDVHNGGRVPWVWKREFQGRGAPHAHIYTCVGAGRAFGEWVALAWTNSIFGTRCRRLDGESWDELVERVDASDRYSGEWVRSLLAGTSIDWSEGLRASDPKRLAVYFLKLSSGHNLGRDKEYQNRVPDAWAMRRSGPVACDHSHGPCWDGCDLPGRQRVFWSPSVGRFWGYRGLAIASKQVRLTETEFVQLRRLMRRWAKSKGRPVPWLGRGRMLGGMVLLNDAPGFFRQASVWLAQLDRRTEWVDADGVIHRPLRDDLDLLAVRVVESRYLTTAPTRAGPRAGFEGAPHSAYDCESACMDHSGVVDVAPVKASHDSPW